jgi:hypothetical protein
MVFERTKKEVIFKLSSSLKIDELQDISDFLDYFEVSRSSKASQKEVNDLVSTIKKGRWLKTKTSLNL